MPTIRYQVRIPPALRARFHGKDRLTKRFVDPAKGEVWEKKIHLQLAQMKAARKDASESEAVGLVVVKEITVRAAFGKWYDGHHAGTGTKKWYMDLWRAHLKRQLGDEKVSSVDADRITAFFKERRSAKRRWPMTDHTLFRCLLVLKMILDWAKTRGYRVDPSAMSFTMPKPPPTYTRRYSPDDTRRFLQSVHGRDRAVLEVVAATGFRAGEVRAFDCKWIRWDERRIHIPNDIEFLTKDRDERSIPLFSSLEATLKAWLGERRSGRVFPPEKGGAGVYIRGIIAKAKKASGVKFRNAHDLRHYYLSWMASLGVPLRDLQELAGHESAETTQKYLHVAEDYLARSRDRAEAAVRAAKQADRAAAAAEIQKLVTSGWSTRAPWRQEWRQAGACKAESGLQEYPGNPL